MGRFYEGDCDDVYGLLAAGRFTANERQVFKSKRGQVLLQKLEDALLKMPQRKLIANHLCVIKKELQDYGYGPEEVEYAEYCTLGAFGHEIGIEDKAMAVDDSFEYEWEGPENSYEVADLGNMTHTMAWILGYTNDETLRKVTPEQRWQKVFDLVQKAKETGVWNY